MTSPAYVNPNTEGIPDQPTNSPPLTEGEADSAQAQGSFEDEYAGLKKVEDRWMVSTSCVISHGCQAAARKILPKAENPVCVCYMLHLYTIF